MVWLNPSFWTGLFILSFRAYNLENLHRNSLDSISCRYRLVHTQLFRGVSPHIDKQLCRQPRPSPPDYRKDLSRCSTSSVRQRAACQTDEIYTVSPKDLCVSACGGDLDSVRAALWLTAAICFPSGTPRPSASTSPPRPHYYQLVFVRRRWPHSLSVVSQFSSHFSARSLPLLWASMSSSDSSRRGWSAMTL